MFKKRKILGVLKKYQKDEEVIIITGFRRVGKTSLLNHLYENIKSGNKIFLDLESPVNQRLFQEENYDNIKFKLVSLGLNFAEKAYIFLDEIQNIKTLPSIVKYLYDHHDLKFYLTGSSSFYLKNLFSESLAGRKYLFELYPLDFEEFLWFKNKKITVNAGYDFLSGLYEEYLNFGGLPGVVLEQSPEKKLLKIDDVLASYFQLDVRSLANFRDNENLKNLLFLLSSRVGSKPDISKLADALNTSRQTVYQYLNFFEQTYLIKQLRPFSLAKDVQIRSLPKIYFVDTGILSRIAKISKATLFENKIFNQLFLKTRYLDWGGQLLQENLHYYQTKTGVEINFIVGGKTAIEVKLLGSIYDLNRLARICRKLGIEDYKIVSLEKVRAKNSRIIYPYAL